MKRLYSIALSVVLLSFPNNVEAQYTFTVSLSITGNCGGLDGAVYTAASQALYDNINQYLNTLNMNKQECLAMRAQVEAESGTYNGCTARFIVSPCVGSGGDEGATTATEIILGPTQGRSFYSTNGLTELGDWMSDEERRRLALDPDYSPYTLGSVKTSDKEYDSQRMKARNSGWTLDPDKSFRSLNIDEKGGINTPSSDLTPLKEFPSNSVTVSRYLTEVDRSSAPPMVPPEDYIEWMKQQFQELSGYDVDYLAGLFNPTEKERKALANYRDFVDALVNEAWKEFVEIDNSEEKKQIDMAILAYECYGGIPKYLENTNYRPVSLSDLPDDNPYKNVAWAIEQANASESLTGFHAELFYNEVTNEYTVGLAGSGSQLEDWINNAMQATGVEFPQQILCNAIIDAINQLPDGAKINIVGHSLGGALASYIGLATGAETYTYNAEGVSDNILAANGLLDKKNSGDYQITAYYNPDDILSNVQDAVPSSTYVSSAIGTRVEMEDMHTVEDELAAVSPITNVTNKFMSHRMGPIVDYNMSKYEDTHNSWKEHKQAASALNSERGRARMRTMSSIRITIND